MPAPAPVRECAKCGSALIPMYPDGDKRVQDIPLYCERCVALFIGGKKIVVNEMDNSLVGSLKDLEAIASDQIVESIKNEEKLIFENPSERIRAYFKRVFNWAFTEGFLRAYAQFKHQYKEGRIKRIRHIWSAADVDLYKCVVMGLSKKQLEELDRLINL